MRPFIHPDFLLDTPQARTLYHEYAEPCPVIDYHCHLSPKEIAENRPFANITQAWLGGDHYKWRAMRTVGVPERLITGDADDHAKFLAWCDTVPKLLRNPLYHWSHLELARVVLVHKVGIVILQLVGAYGKGNVAALAFLQAGKSQVCCNMKVIWA